MTLLHRRLTTAVFAVVLMALAGGTVSAQRTLPTLTPSPSPSPTPTPQPSVTPSIEQRFEQPGLRRQTMEQELRRYGRYEWYRPVIRVGQSFELKADDSAHDVRGVLSDFVIEGHVTGDLVAVLGDVRLGERAVIDGSLVVVGGNVTAAKGARVNNDFVLVGGTVTAPPDFMPQGDHVVVGTPAMGAALRAFVPWVTKGLALGRIIVPDLGWIWPIVFAALFIGLVLNLLFNRPVAACADTVARRPLTSFLMGLLVLTLLPIFFVILAASVIGVLVIPFAVGALIVAIAIGRVAVTRAIGRMILRESDSTNRIEGIRSYLIGAAIVIVAYMIPVIGLLTWMFVGSFALGSATMTAFGSWRRERPAAPPKPVPPPPSAPPPGPSAHVSEPPPYQPPMDTPPAAPAFSAAAPDISGAAPPVSAGPSPAMAAAVGDYTLFPRATFLDRLAAVALEFVLVGIATAILGFDRFHGPGPFFMILFLYHMAFWAWKGTTLGGIICSVRIIRSSRAPLRAIDAVVRGLSAIFSVVALGMGYFWMINDPERQTWHDKIAGTFVVKLPRDLVLE